MSHETRVLLAEDDEHIAKLISFKLKKEGFKVTWAVDGQLALTAALSEKWDVIVLDVMMPHLTGWQVLQTIRAAHVSVPILMLTAKGDETDIARARELGATHFLKKPFDPMELVQVLRQMIPDPEMVQMTAEFIESFQERLVQLELGLKKIYSQPIDGIFSNELASSLHFTLHSLAGVAKNYGFPELGSLASNAENELLRAIGNPMGSVGVAKTIRFAKELGDALASAQAQSQAVTSFEESPASEAMP